MEWAAAAGDGKPSERLAFIKDMLGFLSEEELKRLKKMVQLKKRRVVEDKRKVHKIIKPKHLTFTLIDTHIKFSG